MEFKLPDGYMNPPESTIVDPGKYLLRVIEAEDTVSKSGNKMIAAKLALVDYPDMDDVAHWCVTQFDPETDEFLANQYERFHKAFEVAEGATAAAFIGCEAMLDIVVDTFGDDNRKVNKLSLRGEIVPNGMYPVTAKSAKLKMSKNGNPMFSIWHTVDDQGDIEDIPVTLMIPTKTKGFIKDRFRSYLMIFGIEMPDLINDATANLFSGKIANVGIKVVHGDDGVNRNEIQIPIIQEEIIQTQDVPTPTADADDTVPF